jgi:3-oxoadipate enol-lactonase
VPFIEGPDCRLHVEVIGEGDPVTVFAHGITSSLQEIEAFTWRTAGTRVLFDFRGHGRSDSPPEDTGYDYPAMRRDLEFVADAYDATRALGVSMGAGALLNLLADSPDRFERLLFFIPARIDEPTPASRERYPVLAGLLESHSLEEVADIIVNAPESEALFAARPAWRELMRARVLRMNATGVPRALRAFVDGRPPITDASALRRVTAPALILSHENDPIHPADVARRIGDLLPNADVRVWPEPLAMLDDFGEFADTVGSFLVPGAAA